MTSSLRRAAACALLFTSGLSVGAPLTISGCGSTPGAADGGAGSDGATTTIADDGATTIADGGVTDGTTPTVPLPGACGADKMCLDVGVDAGAKPMRIAVLWVQLDDDGPDPVPELAYDAPVDAAATRVEIATSAVKAPIDEKNLLCDRAGDDEALFPCLSEPKVGYGGVIAYVDNDGDQKFDGFKGADVVVGYANAIFGYSEKAHAPGAWPTHPSEWDRMWPKGIGAGVRIYQVERPDGSVFDRPVPSAAGITNVLGPKGPNLD